MDEYLLFEAFENGEYIQEQDIKKAANYICGHLISWSPNQSYLSVSITTQLSYNLFVNGSENMGLLLVPKKEKQYAMINLLTFLKKKIIKIAFVQKFK